MSQMDDDGAALSDFEDDDLEAAPVVVPSRSQAADPAEDGDARYVLLKKELDRHLEGENELRKALADSSERLEQVVKQRDDAQRQLENISRQREDASKARTEIETSAKLLIAGAEKLTGLVGDNKGFTGGFPRSSKYTGLAAICHGFCKRTEELMEEVLKQRDAAIKSRNEARSQMEQRNYQIAIEVSQLEASVVRSKEELERRSSEWEKLSTEKLGVQRELEEKLAATSREVENLKKKCESTEAGARSLESDLDDLRKKLVEQMRGYLATEESVVNFLQKIEGKAVKAVPELPFSNFSDAERVHKEYLRRVQSISDTLAHMKNSWEEKEELRLKEKADVETELQRLSQREKDMVSFLKNSLFERKDTGEEVDMPTLANVMDSELRSTRLKVLDSERQLADASMEIEKMKKLSSLQAKDLAAKTARVQELELRYGIVSENVEGLTAEIAAAEEELLRWKKAATEEAAAGVAILEEVEKCNQEVIIILISLFLITTLNQLVVHLRQSLEEANSKLQSKEEMAAAAIAARNAADRSLKIADERAAELRERLEEMSRQLEDVEAQVERSRICGGKLLEVFPWLQGRISSYRANLRQATVPSAEMEELTEPLV
ncbi:hypothetical protein SELMODRAFT_415737 [Selaginella moellendorffii]|uniref:Uncharacterized protein n=1 Tax=Selaginella moellendorffii TaxID=88036 RepID=D8RX31_SELML|nr:hypothetical protein SELMODRAFT_415737 [Selaginella moellendorffii]